MRLRTLLLAGLLAGGPAIAQDYGTGEAADTGQVRGPITSIDLSRGQMTIAIGGGETMVLRGSPGQLRDYRRGEVADVDYEMLGKYRWLTGEGDESTALDESRTHTVRGAVSSVDKADGRVSVTTGTRGTLSFEAHPEVVRSLVPGQFVSLTYQRVGPRNWVTTIEEGGYYDGED